MQRGSLWTRMSQLFKPGAHPGRGSGELPPIGTDGLVEPADAERGFARDDEGDDDANRTAPALSRRRQREETLGRLEEGFERVVQLCDSLQTHFSKQEDRTARIADSLADVAGGMSQLTAVVERQSETMQVVAEQLEASNNRSERLQELVGQFSKLTEAQRQTLAVVSQQVDAARKTDERIVESLGTFQEAIASMGRSCAASAAVLEDVHAAETERDHRVGELIEKQSRRFTRLFVVTLLVAGVSIVGTMVALILRSS